MYTIDSEKLRAKIKECKTVQHRVATKVFAKLGKKYTSSTTTSKFTAFKDGKRSKMEVETIAEVLTELGKKSCAIEEFCSLQESAIVTYQLSDIYKLYEELEKGDIVSIISQDGFLEASDKSEGLFEKMCNLAKKGVEIRYYYPNINPSKGPSHKDYEALKNKYAEADGIPNDLIAGYMLHRNRKDVIGWGIRYIAISRWNIDRTQQDVQFVFLYIESSQPKAPVGAKEVIKAWIPFHDSVATLYLKELQQSSEPIKDLGIYTNRLKSQVQETYQQLFSDLNNVSAYKEMRKWAGTDNATSKALEMWGKYVNKDKLPDCISLLDIGTGDGHILSKFIDGLHATIGEKQSIHLTVIEPAQFRIHELNNCIIPPSLIHPVHSTFEEYEESAQRNHDIIMSCQSLYVIDPTYLKKMYNLLSDVGILLIIMSPFESNIINQLTHYMDSLLPKIDRRIKPILPYEDKKIKTDPFRNYAEDIEVYLNKYFVDASLKKMTVKCTFDTSKLISKGNPTEQCRQILALFSRGELVDKRIDKYKTEIVNIIKNASKDDNVENDVNIYLVSKAIVRQTLMPIVNGAWD